MCKNQRTRVVRIRGRGDQKSGGVDENQGGKRKGGASADKKILCPS